MAWYNWQSSGSTDFQVAANWGAGSHPASAANNSFNVGATQISFTNLPATLAYDQIVFNEGFEGSFGTSGAPFLVDDVNLLQIDAPLQNAMFVSIANTKVIKLLNVLRTKGRLNPFTLVSGGGYATKMFVGDGGFAKILSGGKVTALHLGARGASCEIDSGATLVDAQVDDGLLALREVLSGSLRCNGGITNFEAGTALTLPALYVAKDGVFNFASNGGIITDVIQLSGHFNGNCGNGANRTITNYYWFGGTRDLSGRGQSITITNDKGPKRGN